LPLPSVALPAIPGTVGLRQEDIRPASQSVGKQSGEMFVIKCVIFFQDSYLLSTNFSFF
jgi:hypothetical protein